MLADGGSRVIAHAIISLSLALGLSVIAEGVETKEQRDFLSRMGCHSLQGYLISPALSLDEFELWHQASQGTPLESLMFPEAGDYCRFWFEPVIKDAGIPGYTWHCNRHTFRSWLAVAGVSIKEIQELAGHKTIPMAARYAHLSPATKASFLSAW